MPLPRETAGQARRHGTRNSRPLDVAVGWRYGVLELRPVCEHCGKALPPNSTEARICSYECTFCAACVDDVLHDVCPNCGGGFVPRPIRPARNWRGDNWLGKDPAITVVRHRPVDLEAHAQFIAAMGNIPPHER